MGFLTDHVAAVRRRLADDPLPHEELARRARAATPALDVVDAIVRSAKRDGLAVVAEVKRASPSAGAIAMGADPAAQANAYEAAGAAAISVLTESEHFDGSLEDLREVRASVGRPLLRKDFLVHPDQILEARAAGADSVLLIAACLDDSELSSMLAAARDVGMEPLVETHTDLDLERVLATDARLVGVNARDLETLDVDLPSALGRLVRIGAGRVAVSESGIRTHADARAARDAGASAILVGETLMRAADPEATLRELIHGKEPHG
jgi:indole-3-glycerol phosphate synthase